MRVLFHDNLIHDIMMHDNILRGPTVHLTAMSKDDLPIITGWYEDAGFGRLFDATPAAPRSPEQWAKWLDEQHASQKDYLFAIRCNDDNLLIGYVNLDGILWSHRNCWLAIGLGDRANWGKGYGREAMELALKFAFDELNLHRVQLTVFSYNTRAIALYQKLGFTREGVFREHLRREGQYFDMILFGLLRREWLAAAGPVGGQAE
jgi:RimJ/RimL family protein N-acetyltransferase